MNILLDTHVLLWAANAPDRLAEDAREIIGAPENGLYFSVASIWEVAIKASLGRDDFQVEPHLLRRGLLDAGYVELPITAAHALEVASLPPHHGDPFDRMLVAQARCEGALLLTADQKVALYEGPIRLVRAPSLRHP